MNTPPTMNTASLPMAPTKSSKNKQLNKLDIRPKKLLYNDPDVENDSIESIVKESMAIQEKLKISDIKSFEEINDFTKHIEQNELDNEAEGGGGQIEHSYNLRRRNINSTLQNSKQELKKKSTQKKIVDKENVQLENPSTSDFDSKGFPFLQPDGKLNIREKIIWLQKRRDIGLWIECCNTNCKKWRYVEEYRDPLQVPKKWFCCMNSDKNFSSCDADQDSNYYKCHYDLIANKYNAGSIVWGKINGYPWWPGLVDDCPETLKFYELKGSSLIPVRYHVTFFEKDVTRSWLTEKRIKPLQAEDILQPVKRPQLIYKKKNYTKDVKKYLTLAKSALSLSITERLEKFSFVSRYNGEIINESPKRILKRKKPCRVGIFKSSKKRKSITKSDNIAWNKIENINSDKLNSKLPISRLESKIDVPKNLDSPLASCLKSEFQNVKKLTSAINQSSSESSLDTFKFLKPLPKTIVNSSSESPLVSKTTNSSSGPIIFDSKNSPQSILPTSLISTPTKKDFPSLESSCQLSFKSSSDESFLSIGCEPSLPTPSATDSEIENELSQLIKSSLDADKTKDVDSDVSLCSSPFGGGEEGREMNRLVDELIKNYDSFDPTKLDEIDLDDLKKRCNFDEKSSTDSDEEEERKWFYILETDNGSNSDSSDSDVASTKNENKSSKIVKTRIENFDEFLDKAIEEMDKVRVKPPSPPLEVKERLKKFLFLR